MRAQNSVLLLIFTSQVFGGVFDPERAVAQAIDQMLQIHFVKKLPKVDLIFFGHIKKSQNIIDFLMQNNKDQISFQVIDGNCFSSQQLLLNSSSILLFESVQNFTRSFKNITWRDNYNDELKNHLAYFPKGLETDLDFIKVYISMVENATIAQSSIEMEFEKFEVQNQNLFKITFKFKHPEMGNVENLSKSRIFDMCRKPVENSGLRQIVEN